MPKLNQIIAVEKTVKAQNYKAFGDLYKLLKKSQLFNGFSKKYKPVDEDGAKLPPENTKVQHTVIEAIAEGREFLTKMWDIVVTKDMGNMGAQAAIEVEGFTTAPIAATSLVFLEKQLKDVKAFIQSLPVLPTDEDWTYDENKSVYATQPRSTHRTQRITKPIVKYDATPEHPAQTDLIQVDEVVGYWETVKMSGGMPVERKKELLLRADELTKAVKFAREKANSVEVQHQKIAEDLLNWLFAD